MLYLIALTGGYEQPSFEGFIDLDAAIDKMRSLAVDMGKSSISDGENSIDLLSIDPLTGYTERVGGTSLDGDDNVVYLDIPGRLSEIIN